MSLGDRLTVATKLLVFSLGNIADLCCQETSFVQSLRFRLLDYTYPFPNLLLALHGHQCFSTSKQQIITQLYGPFRPTTYNFYPFSLNPVIPDQDSVT